MEKNFFEDFQSRKIALKQYAIKAKEYGWIDEQRMNEIITKLDDDTLVIGVIGQMKCGKSTFLNAFVFEDDILPAATTPMTAALSVIKYGEKKKIIAEFYNQDEWAEQKMQAKRDLSEINNELEISKVKAAKELVEKSHVLGSSVNSYLGKSKEDTFDNLIEYVGADGKYVSITKSVTIYYPKDYLKGVEIVDTPGFNDPIVSREERTKDFLKKADVVILLLYSERAFDNTDQSILFQNVRSCGIGKVIVGINKYDIPFCNENTPEYGDIEAIVKYVKKEINKACESCGDNRLNEILQDVTPIPMSAEMALLSKLPMSKIQNDANYHFHWNSHCKNFGISTPEKMWEYSRIENMTKAIIQLVKNEKGKILFSKPINSIMAAGDKVREEIEKEIMECDTKIAVYGTPDDEIEEKRANLQKAIRRVDRKIMGLENSLDEEFDYIIRKTKNAMEDVVDSAIRRLNQIVDDWKKLDNFEKVRPQLNNVIDKLQQRDLKRCVEEQQESAQRKLRSILDDFFEEVDEIFYKYLPDIDQKGFLNEAKRAVKLTVDEDLFKIDQTEESTEEITFKGVLRDFVNAFLDGYTFGLYGKARDVLSHDANVCALKDHFNRIQSQFDAKEYLQSILSNKTVIIQNVKEKYQEELLFPIQKEYDDLVTNINNKERILEEAKQKKESLRGSKTTIMEQLNEMSSSLQAI